MVWTLFLLVVAAVVAVFIWDVRRKATRREAASRERFEQIFRSKAAAPAAQGAAGASSISSTARAAGAAAVPAPGRARERFLGRAESLVYYLLKAGLPDHEVFPSVPLATVVGAGGEAAERELQLRRLSQHVLDFVVCDKAMRVVAVVELEKPAPEDPSRRFRADALEAAGVRRVSVDPAALPAREAIRALIAGA